MWSAASARTVTYDPANERNELTGYTDNGVVTALSYDDNGNLIGDGASDFHVHNAQNQLISAVRGSDTASFLYGPNGRRVEMTINGVRTRLVHAGDMEIAELTQISGQWKIKTRYVPAAGIDRRVAMIAVNTSNGATLAREYYHHDRLGSVRAMVSETGSVLAWYVYTPFGVEDYGASGNPFRFTGQRYDAAIELYYYRARYYDPELGRFLQTDPILYEDQMNLYAYVHNSPLMGTDPTGMDTVLHGRPDPRVPGLQRTGSVTVSADLSADQVAALESNFSEFINANDGADLRGHGAVVVGDSESDNAFVSAVSEFVGYARGEGTWDNTTIFVEGGGRAVAGEVEWDGWGEYDPETGGWTRMDIRLTIYMNWAEHRTNGSEVARTLIHERLHYPDEFGPAGFSRATVSHLELDALARDRLDEYGLGGGGCSSLSAGWLNDIFYGPKFPGCH